jgi:hypothetical protein
MKKKISKLTKVKTKNILIINKVKKYQNIKNNFDKWKMNCFNIYYLKSWLFKSTEINIFWIMKQK